MQTTTAKRISARRLTVLLLLSVKDANGRERWPILGTTRMQKLVFLVSDKTMPALGDSTYLRFDFNYEPERFGPADLDLYQDLDFLRAMQLITWTGADTMELSKEPTLSSLVEPPSTKTPALLPEEKEEEELSFEYLIGVEPMELLATDTEMTAEREYCITDAGFRLIGSIRSQSVSGQKEHFEILERACAEVRQQFGDWSLRRLLKYIYGNYASLTTKSTIRESVEGNR